MQQSTSATKRIARNTIFMYGRMILLMAISLYTSRVVLQALGVSDYGIYNVVGSVVMMFTSLRTIFASSTQRFLNYEMGKGNESKLNNIFNLSLQVNVIIALIFIIAVEGVGIWFIAYKLNAETSRIFAAHCVLQFSILSAVIALFTTSFDAEIIAHERMDFYAYMAVIDAVLKLSVVFVVDNCNTDKLILYGALILACTIIVFLCNVFFCRYNFSEVRLRFVRDKSYLKQMMTFAGWNFFGNTAYALSQNGMNMILNIFGGPIVNAARGIAYQMNGVLLQIIGNVGTVIKPYIIQTYAKGEISKSLEAIYLFSKVFFVLQLFIVSFFSFLAEYVIKLWLGQVPQYVVVFLIIVLWQSLIRSLHTPIDLFFFATGKLKNYQICEGVMLSLPVVVSYFLLRWDYPYYSVFLTLCVFEIINLSFILVIAKRESKFPLFNYVAKVVKPCMMILLPYIVVYYIVYNHSYSVPERISILMLLYCVIAALAFFIGLETREKQLVKSIMKIRRH